MIHAKRSSMRSIVPPNDRISTTATISAVVIHVWAARSAPAGSTNRPMPAANSAAAAVPASAGQPSWKNPMIVQNPAQNFGPGRRRMIPP
jgi:hypothetical protein